MTSSVQCLVREAVLRTPKCAGRRWRAGRRAPCRPRCEDAGEVDHLAARPCGPTQTMATAGVSPPALPACGGRPDSRSVPGVSSDILLVETDDSPAATSRWT